MPKHFFPNAAPDARAFLWYYLIVRKHTIHTALSCYLSDIDKTPIEQEVADMVAEGFEEDWRTYLATDRIKRTIETYIVRQK